MTGPDTSNHVLHNLADSIPVGIIQQDRNGEIVYANTAACKLFSFTEHNPRQFNWIALNDNGTPLEQHEYPLQKVLATGEPFPQRIIAIQQNNNLTWLTIQAVPLMDENGIVEQVVTTFTSLPTANKNTPVDHVKEQKQKLVQKHPGHNLWEHDLVKKETWFSENIAPLLGYDANEITDTVALWWGSIHPDDKELAYGTYHQYQEGKINWHNIEYRIIRRNAGILWISDNGYAYDYDSNGRPVKLIGLHHDISEKKRLEERMHHTDEMFRSLVTAVKEYAIYMIDTQGNVITWNKGAEMIKGYTEEEVKGKNIRDFYTPEDAALGLPEHNLQMASRQGHFESEGWRIRKDGSRFWANVITTVLCDNNNIKYGYVNVTRDATERRNEEKILLLLNEKLSASNRDLEQFAYVASHDLQEPLRMVSSFLQLLQKKYHDKLDQTANQYIGFAINGAGRMRSLISDLLKFSRISLSDHSMEEVDTASLVTEIFSRFNKRISQGDIIIKVSNLPKVAGLKLQLDQLFTNLVSNAIKYNNNSPISISIGCTELNNEWQFYVRDNGIGIKPEFFEKIFVIFQRLHLQEEYNGTGIGLAICKKIVELHNGRIWVESAEGQGTTFYFTLPKIAP